MFSHLTKFGLVGLAFFSTSCSPSLNHSTNQEDLSYYNSELVFQSDQLKVSRDEFGMVNGEVFPFRVSSVKMEGELYKAYDLLNYGDPDSIEMYSIISKKRGEISVDLYIREGFDNTLTKGMCSLDEYRCVNFDDAFFDSLSDRMKLHQKKEGFQLYRI